MKKIFRVNHTDFLLNTKKVAENVHKKDKNGRFYSFLEAIDKEIYQKTHKFAKNEEVYYIFDDLMTELYEDFDNIKDN